MKPLIIEFNGLSGSGKTTVAKSLVEKLHQAGIPVETSDDVIHLYHGKPIIKMMSLLKYSGIRFNIDLFRYLISLKPISWYRFRCLTAVWTFIYIYKESEKRNSNIIVIDQGIIQSLAATVYLNNLKNYQPIRRVLKKLNEFNFNYVIVNSISDGKLASERIQFRNERNNRFDCMDKYMLEPSLKMHKGTFKKIRKLVKENMDIQIVDIEMSRSIEENSINLFNIIYESQFHNP